MRGLGWRRALCALAAGVAAAAAATAAEREDAIKGAQRALKLDPQIASALLKPYSLSEEQQRAVNARVAEARKAAYEPGLRASVPSADWIDIAYHGALYDANYERIVVDEKTAFEIQESLFAILKSAAKPEALSQISDGDIAKAFYAENEDTYARLVVRSTVLEAMLGAVPAEIDARYAWRHRLLQREIQVLGAGRFWQIHPEVLRLLKEGRFRVPPGGWLTPEPSTAYMDECEANDVPIPPDFPGPLWKSQGEQLVEFILTEPYRTEAFAYQAPNGVCMALPRTTGGRIYSDRGIVQYDGIICQSESSGKACFWDNINRATGAQITGNPVSLDIALLKDGSNLVENCTRCHRGDNVFNIHPGTAVDVRRPSTSAPGEPPDGRPYDIYPGTPAAPVRYSPIGSNRYEAWANPGPLSLPGAGFGCSSCHSIGDTTTVIEGDGMRRGGYCGILEMAANATMPDGGPPVGWRRTPVPDPAPATWHHEHVGFLFGRCPP